MICPNLSDPQVRREFSEMASLFGEPIAYLLWDKNGGYPLDKTSEGEQSSDYDSVFNETKDRTKAMQMRAMTFGSNFKKFTDDYNKDFADKNDRLPYGHKAAALYMQANNQKTIEELIQESLKNSSLLRPITEAISQLQKQDVARDRSWFNITKKEQAQAYLWYKNHPISKSVPFRNLSRVVNNTSFASLENMVIKLYQGGDFTLLYHETWHAFSQAYLTKPERDAIYTLIRDRVGTRNGVAYNDMLREQIEEVLAEEFEDYVREEQGKKKESVREPWMKRLFSQIMAFFNSILRSNPKDTIKEYYKNLYYADFTRKRNDSNIEFASLSASRGIIGNYRAEENLGIPENVIANLKQGYINGFNSQEDLPDGLFVVKTGENSSATISLVRIGENNGLIRYMAHMQQEFQVGVAAGVEVFKSFDFMFYEGMRKRGLNVINVMSNKALRSEIYDEIKGRFEIIYSEKKKQWLELSKTMPGSAMADHLQEQFQLLFDVTNAFERFRDEHRKMMNKTLSEVRDIVEAAGQDDETTKTREGWEVDPFGVNPIDNADAIIYTFVKSLPDMDSRADSKGNELIKLGQFTGLPQTGNFDLNWNILIKTLNGLTSYDEMRKELSGLSKSFPQFKVFLSLLPDSQATVKDPSELAITQGMLQTFSSPEIQPFALQIVEKGVSKKAELKQYLFNLYELHSTAAKKVKRDLDIGFQNDDTRKYRQEKDNEFYLDTTAIVKDWHDKFMNEKNTNFKLDFLADVTGLDFRSELDNPLVSHSANMANIKKFADHIYKMAYVNNLDIINSALDNDVNGKKAMLIRNPLGGLSRTWSNSDYKIKNTAYAITADKKFKDPLFQKFGVMSDFRHETEEITTLYDRVFQVHGDQSFINPEGSMQWSIMQWNELNYQINAWNAAKSTQDLMNNLHTKQLVEKDFFRFSAFAKKSFAEIGGKKLLGPGGVPSQLRVINWSGVTSKVTMGDGLRKDGYKSTSIDSQDKFVYDFFSYINNGLFENLRFGSKNISLAVATDGAKKNRQVYPTEEFLQDQGAIMSPAFLSQMINYLAYEVTTSPQYNGRLATFSDILSEGTKKQVMDLVGLEDEQLVRKLKQGELGQKIRDEITDFFVDDTKEFIRGMKFALLTGHLKDKPEKQDERLVSAMQKFDIKVDNIKDLQRMVLAYLSNYYAHQTEILNLFISDIRNYQVKNENFKEVFKRLGFVSSPGRQPLMSNDYVASFQRFYKRELGSISSDKEQAYDNKVRFAVGKDIVTNATNESTTIAYYERQIAAEREATGLKPLTKDDLSKEAISRYDEYRKQNKEADAQAWGNLDFMRNYLFSIRRWTPQHEAAYRREKAIWESHVAYRKAVALKEFDKAEELLKTVNRLMRSIPDNPALFPSLKLGFYGAPLEHPNMKTLGKFSVNILLPSVIIGSDLEELADSMFETQTDIYTFKSGSKMQFPAQEHSLYSQDGKSFSTNRITADNVAEYSIEGLREQQYIAPIFKGKATLSTQLVKLIFGDFFNDGQISEDFKSVKEQAEGLQRRFTESLSNLIEVEKITLAGRMGVKFDGDKVVSVDKKKFFQWLAQEADKKEINQDFIEFAHKMSKSNDPYSIDSLGFRNLVESMLMTSVNKKVIKPKFNGEAFIQTASTGYNKKDERFINPSVDDLETFGTNGLRDYRIVNGKTEPADIKIAFNPKKHAGLLELDFNGRPIKTLGALNKALQDDAWVKEHSDKISIAGVRIPVQGFNSMEHFRVREFLPTSAGPIIIVPPSIVTKSGSDFDIDKLFMYEPILGEDGQMLNIPFDKQILIDRDAALTEADSAIQDINAAIDSLEESSGIEDISKEDMKFLKDFKAKYAEVTSGKKKKLDNETSLLVYKFNSLTEQLSKQQDKKDVVAKLEELKKELNAWEVKKNLTGISTPSAQKYSLQNEVLRVMRETLSMPELYSRLTKPNDSRLLYGKGGAINDVYEFINKHTDSKNHQEVDQPMSASSVPSAKASTIIHKDGIGGKKPLGVVAKANALHKLYQQAGLRWINPAFKVGFVLPHNTVNGDEIPLGSVYNVEGESIADLISQFINGHVDVEKEDWINRIRSDKKRAPLYMQLIMQGVPVRTAITFMMQPSLNEYFRDSKNSFFKKLVIGKSINKNKVFHSTLLEGLKILHPGVFNLKSKTSEMVAFVLSNQEYRNILTNFSLKDSAKNYLPSTKDVAEDGYSKMLQEKDTEKLKHQVAVLAQYKILEEQNDVLFQYSSNVDFNTAQYATLQEAYNNREFIRRGFIGESPLSDYFNEDALNFIKDQSVVSPFNVSDYAVELNKEFSTIAGNENYMSKLNAFSQERIAKRDWHPSTIARDINNFNNGFIESLMWNFSTYFERPSKEGERNYYTLQERFPHTLFQKGTPNSLRDRWNLIKKSPYFKDVPTAGWKNMKFRQSLYDGNIYYPILIPVTSDASTVDAYKQEFETLLSFKHKDPDFTEMVQDFFYDLGMGVKIHQGFKTRRDTIQGFLPLSLTADVIENAIQNFKPILEDPGAFDEYFARFANILYPPKQDSMIDLPEDLVKKTDRNFINYYIQNDFNVILRYEEQEETEGDEVDGEEQEEEEIEQIADFPTVIITRPKDGESLCEQ